MRQHSRLLTPVLICIVLSVALAACSGASGRQQKQGALGSGSSDKESIVFVPFRYGFDTLASTAQFSCVFYANVKNPSITQINAMKDTKICVGDEQLACKIQDIQFDPDQKIVGRSNNYYPGSITISIPKLYEIPLAQAVISYRLGSNESDYRYSLGSMGISVYRESQDNGISFATIQGAQHNVGDSQVVSDVILCCDVDKNIEINDINFGFDDFGIRKQDIRVFKKEDYLGSIDSHVQNATLNKVIDAAYKERIESTKTSCSINLTPGQYYLYIPLTKSSTADYDPIRLSADISYTASGNVSGRYQIPSFAMFTLLDWNVNTNMRDLLGAK